MGLDETVRQTFSAINTELKALMLGFLLDNNFKSAWTLYQEAVDLGLEGLIPKNPKSLSTHLKSAKRRRASLEPFVETREIEKGSKTITQYRLRPEARKIMPAIARFALYFPIKFDISLYSLLGQDVNDGPYNSVRILQLLSEKGHAQRKDLEEELGIAGSAILERLKAFDDLDLIQLHSFDPEQKGQIKYKWRKRKSAKRLSDNGGYKNQDLYERIGLYMSRVEKEQNYIDVMEALGIPEERRRTVQAVLRRLENKGFLTTSSPWEGGVKYSEITIKHRGRKVYDEFIAKILSALSEDRSALAYIARKAIYEENLPRALEAYNLVSSHGKQKSAAERQAEIIEMLAQGPMRQSAIHKRLGVRPTRYLAKLVKSGSIVRIGRGVYALNQE
ncbi:hypothetical protein D6745_02910 [Candidatus Woesearchaeota archaeon]|nr:MAG: hypothetical protein D6745_02910 [Candidatus Woesearchaeota archaeon]